MKIMVYTYAVHGLPSTKIKDLLRAKEDELKSKLPYASILVIPGPQIDGDRVTMIDLTPTTTPYTTTPYTITSAMTPPTFYTTSPTTSGYNNTTGQFQTGQFSMHFPDPNCVQCGYDPVSGMPEDNVVKFTPK